MEFEMTNYFALQTGEPAKAAEFYSRVFKLPKKNNADDFIVFDAGPFTLCISKGEQRGAVLEFAVDDTEAAVEILLREGCEIVAKDKAGKPRFFKDPFGLVFHLYQAQQTI